MKTKLFYISLAVVFTVCASLTLMPSSENSGPCDSLNVTFSGPTVLCYGECAYVTATAYGGKPPYNYSWNNGATGEPVLLCAGNWMLTVTDAQGCTKAANITLVSNPPVVITTTANT